MSTKSINIDDLVGAKYKEFGRNLDEGFDCYGLVMEVERRFGYELPDLSEAEIVKNGTNGCKESLVKTLNVKRVKRPTKPSDLILINDFKGVFFHIGVYMGNNMFIHCNKHGVHLENINFYFQRIGSVYQWQE